MPAAAIARKYTVRRQWLMCLAMVALAWLLCRATATSFTGLFAAPMSVAMQAAVAAGLTLVVCANAWFSYRFAARRPSSQHLIDSYGRLDLRGWNPVWFSLAAGIGEEILFRGALQSVAGIGAASALFVLAHARAYRFNTIDRRVLVQVLGLFGASFVLAAVAHYAGLLVAIVFHIVVDIAGLLAVRQFLLRPNAEAMPRAAETRVSSG